MARLCLVLAELTIIAFCLVAARAVRADESAALFFVRQQSVQVAHRHPAAIRLGFPARHPRAAFRRLTAGAPLELHPLATVARGYVGSRRFTRYARAWCRDALNVWLRQAGYYTDGDGRARAVAKIVRPIARPVVGAVAWQAHHAGVVAAVNGNRVTLISGNYGNRVAVETTAAGRYRYGLPVRVASR